MKERKGLVTMLGNPVTLVGTEIKIGQVAPDFTVTDNDLGPVRLSDFKGKIVLISAVPSLDTSVCSKETQRINEEAKKISADVVFLTISMDLPFAQKRWVKEHNVEHLKTLSDHLDASFGTAWGVLMKENRLLSRSLFIVDRDGKVRYIQLVKENASEPDYDDMLKALKKLA